MSDRQTGRTREQLRACYEIARQGKVALYIVHSESMARYCRELLLTLGPAQLVTRDRVQYDGGGSVRFVSGGRERVGDYLRGRWFDRVAQDHSYGEHMPLEYLQDIAERAVKR